MAVALTSAPEAGQLVNFRARRWVVSEVNKSSLPPRPLEPTQAAPQHLVSLQSLEDDALGEELQVIWEIEPGATVVEKVALPQITGFDAPDRLDAFLDAVRWGAASTADVRNIQSPFRSGIDIEDYQLDPVFRAIQMPRVNLLIADDVGLGKTIESGLVALELIIRHRARRILVVCPASLQVQWRDQMRDKFGLDFRIVDSELMRDLRRRRGIHVNPWSHFPRLITSLDFLKRERPLRLFKETLPAEGESVYPRRYDLLIVDEAHNCAPAGRGKYATDSLRTSAIRTLAPHFEHKLFLTATPHNGYSESFTALLELLDNQRFARGMQTDTKEFHRQKEAVMVRRLKSELPKDDYGFARFPQRVLEALEVDYPVEEKLVHAALRRYAEMRQANCEDHAERFATDFVLMTLKKRLFSSPAAFPRTLEQHESSLRTAKKRKGISRPTRGILQRQIDRVDEEYSIDDEAEEATRRGGGAGAAREEERGKKEQGVGRGEKKPGGRGRKSKASAEGPSLKFGEDDDEPEPAGDADSSSAKLLVRLVPRTPRADQRVQPVPAVEFLPRAIPIDQIETDAIMAAFRQAARGRGWLERDELLKHVSVVLGYQRLGPKIDESLRGHLRAAIRRRIIEADGPSLVHAGTGTMSDYGLDELRETFRSVMRKGTNYEREDVVHALASYLGFVRVTDTIRQPIKSAINSAIRQGLLGYEGSVIWRED